MKLAHLEVGAIMALLLLTFSKLVITSDLKTTQRRLESNVLARPSPFEEARRKLSKRWAFNQQETPAIDQAQPESATEQQQENRGHQNILMMTTTPTPLEQHQFKYHLSHLHPPSLVPITVQQQRQPHVARSHAHQQLTLNEPTSSTARPESADEHLVQRQLPLQLHLKLKPLPLPMPPPRLQPQTQTTDYTTTGRQPANFEQAEKKKRSLDDSNPSNSYAQSDDGKVLKEKQRRDLMAFTWREAKRILLLSSMSSALSQVNRMERRFGSLNQQTETTTKSPEAINLDQVSIPTTTTTPQPSTTKQSQPGERWTPIKLSSTPSSNFEEQQLVAATSTPTPLMVRVGEVRRQRHSSQQQLQGHDQTTNELSQTGNLQEEDKRIQTLAASMLPLFWPSFQLAGGMRKTNWSTSGSHAQSIVAAVDESQRAALNYLSSAAALPSPPPPSTMSDRQQSVNSQAKVENVANNSSSNQSPVAESKQVPTIISVDATPTVSYLQEPPSRNLLVVRRPAGSSIEVSTANTPQSVSVSLNSSGKLPEPISEDQKFTQSNVENKSRKKPRKPSYLLNSGTPSTPYPDSTRLASKYQMPKIKFQAPPLIIDPQKTTPSPQKKNPYKVEENEQRAVQVPKSLSKLIEEQLLKNATHLLPHLLRQNQHLNANSSLAPTTSVSKVVRISSSSISGVSTTNALTGPVQTSSSTTTTTSTLAPLEILSTTDFHGQADQPQQVSAVNVDAPFHNNEQPRSIGSKNNLTTMASDQSNPDELPQLSPNQQQQQQQAKSETKEGVTERVTTNPSGNKFSLHQQVGNLSSLQSQHEMMIGSNRVLPEEEEANQEVVGGGSSTVSSATTESTSISTGKTANKHQQQQKYNSQSGAGRYKQQQKHEAATASGGGKNNIKLFHFKRKPDMNKLPFYKKPLNYTELGWTSQQIQEHLDSIASQLQLNNNSSDSSAQQMAQTLGEQETQADDSSAPQSSAAAAAAAADQRSLLKRKRRGKNQFERLMAELHGSSSANPLERSDTQTEELSMTHNVGGSQQSAEHEEERVPVMKKKIEPLVMKPMFAVMNQKRRGGSQSQTPSVSSSSSSNEAQSLMMTTTVRPLVGEFGDSTPATASNNKSKPIIRMRRKHHGEQPIAATTNSRPDFFQQFHQTQQAPWKPSSPFWSSRHNQPLAAGDKVVLVQSGLLSPSGSQLVPMFSSDSNSNSLPSSRASELDGDNSQSYSFAWRPTSVSAYTSDSFSPAASWSSKKSSLSSISKSSDGLAPSGEESSLVAPAASNQNFVAGERLVLLATSATAPGLVDHATQPKQQQELLHGSTQSPLVVTPPPQAQSSSAPTPLGELRVPKLLVKPMRPAKYSLNGYIPKPSLNQQPVPTMTSNQWSANQAQSSSNRNPLLASFASNKSSASFSSTSSAQKPAKARVSQANNPSNSAIITNKDLDSSTSNEIFSRRRGLQQHQRSAQAKAQLAFNSLISSQNGLKQQPLTSQMAIQQQQTPLPTDSQEQQHHQSTKSGTTTNLLQQMEENKRKYILQQHQSLARSPTLSIQKANLIKAKLGLVVSSNSEEAGKRRALPPTNQHQQQAASTNTILTSDPDQPSAASTDLVGDQPSGPLIGAPLNSIPKTDFECTDKKGKFIAGLFADQKTGCQVWHLCSNNRKYSFLCPTGTIFNAKLRICDWRYNVKCENPLT